MKYPYIAKLLSYNSKLALFTSPNTATALTDNFSDIKIGESDSEWDEDFYTNTTHEYLSNTWGVVESKEHAEFIIELAESHGIELAGISGRFGKFFAIDDRMLIFLDLESVASRFGIKITIPLPPKAKVEKPNLPKPTKHFDCVCNKCGGKCCAGFCGDWKVGDEVLFTPNPSINSSVLCEVKYIGDKHIILKSKSGREYSKRIAKAIIKKPKSKQDLLIEELQTKLCNNNAVDNYILACDIINGDIEGLSYDIG